MKKFLLMTLLAAFGMAALPAYAAEDEDVAGIEKSEDAPKDDDKDEDCGCPQ